MTNAVLAPSYEMPVLEVYLRVLVEGLAEVNDTASSMEGREDDFEFEFGFRALTLAGSLLYTLDLDPDELEVIILTLEALARYMEPENARRLYQDVYQSYHNQWSLERSVTKWWKGCRLGTLYHYLATMRPQLTHIKGDAIVSSSGDEGAGRTYDECMSWCMGVMTEVLEAVKSKRSSSAGVTAATTHRVSADLPQLPEEGAHK